jgi:hypothetical protein
LIGERCDEQQTAVDHARELYASLQHIRRCNSQTQGLTRRNRRSAWQSPLLAPYPWRPAARG